MIEMLMTLSASQNFHLLPADKTSAYPLLEEKLALVVLLKYNDVYITEFLCHGQRDYSW